MNTLKAITIFLTSNILSSVANGQSQLISQVEKLSHHEESRVFEITIEIKLAISVK